MLFLGNRCGPNVKLLTGNDSLSKFVHVEG